MRAQDLMTSPTLTCHVNDLLTVAAKQMWDGDIGAVAVVNDDGNLAGMITDRDICMAAYTQGRAIDELLVNSAMARHVISATPESTIVDIVQLMAKHQVRRIPIVDSAGKPVGMISMNNLAIECVQPGTAMQHGPSTIAHTLAAICQHGAQTQKAA